MSLTSLSCAWTSMCLARKDYERMNQSLKRLEKSLDNTIERGEKRYHADVERELMIKRLYKMKDEARERNYP